MKNFKLTDEKKVLLDGTTVFRIECIAAFGNISVGEKGGFVENENNLYGNAWVYGDARISGNAQVYGDARVSGNAWVSGNAQVYGDARVYGDAQVYGNARVSGEAWVSGEARVSGKARVFVTQHIFNISILRFNLTITPQNVVGGCRMFTHEEFRNLELKSCISNWKENELNFYKSFLQVWEQMQIIYSLNT